MIPELSPIGEGLIKHYEQCRLVAYPDPGTGGAPWTCGWGTTGSDIYEGVVWSQHYADQRFVLHIASYERGVADLLKVPVTQGQYDALVSFAYNCGLGSLGSSTLLRKVNVRDYAGAGAEFPRWDKAAGVPMRGLKRRRHAEMAVWNGASLADAIAAGTAAIQ
jgi:lysozyme